MMSFAENLQFLRSRAKITQEQLAEQLDVSRQSVSKWESDTSFPEMDTLLRICDLYHTNLDTLLRGSLKDALVEDTTCYDRAMNRFSLQISLSVGAIIAAVGGAGLLYAFGVSDMIAAAFLLFVITVSVVTIVAGSIQHESFCKEHPVIQDFYSKAEWDAFRRRFVWYIAGGVGAILFDVVLLILFFSIFPEREPYESAAGCIFLLILAGAVISFIYGGMQDDKYNIPKYNRDNNPTPEVKKRKAIIRTISGVIMLLATAIYVGMGLAIGAWETAWWLFPVGGILCGVVFVILNPYKGEND